MNPSSSPTGPSTAPQTKTITEMRQEHEHMLRTSIDAATYEPLVHPATMERRHQEALLLACDIMDSIGDLTSMNAIGCYVLQGLANWNNDSERKGKTIPGEMTGFTPFTYLCAQVIRGVGIKDIDALEANIRALSINADRYDIQEGVEVRSINDPREVIARQAARHVLIACNEGMISVGDNRALIESAYNRELSIVMSKVSEHNASTSLNIDALEHYWDDMERVYLLINIGRALGLDIDYLLELRRQMYMKVNDAMLVFVPDYSIREAANTMAYDVEGIQQALQARLKDTKDLATYRDSLVPESVGVLDDVNTAQDYSHDKVVIRILTNSGPQYDMILNIFVHTEMREWIKNGQINRAIKFVDDLLISNTSKSASALSVLTDMIIYIGRFQTGNWNADMQKVNDKYVDVNNHNTAPDATQVTNINTTSSYYQTHIDNYLRLYYEGRGDIVRSIESAIRLGDIISGQDVVVSNYNAMQKLKVDKVRIILQQYAS